MTEKPSLPIPVIDSTCCIGCELCIRICPTNALVMKDGVAFVGNPNACVYTGYCERICPEHAVSRPFQIIFSPKEDTK